jgi:hypothetical protein
LLTSRAFLKSDHDTITNRKEKMKELYYIKCRSHGDAWTCDITASILEANQLLKEYKLNDPHSKFRISNTSGSEGVQKSWFNKARYETYLT